MMENILLNKSYKFSLRVIKLYEYLLQNKKPKEIASQVLRSGTSIGANIEEANGSFTKKDFRQKLSVSYKETRETRFWIRLLIDSNYINKNLGLSLLTDCEELAKIIGKSLVTLRKSL